MSIHPSAVIGNKVKLAEDVIIGPFCHIDGDVTISSGCVLDSHVRITGHTCIGKNNKIFSFANIGVVPQDLKFKGEPSQVIIGNNNTIREYVSIHLGTQGGGSKTIIGNQNLIMAYVHIAHDCAIANNCILANATQLAGHIHIQNNVNVGGATCVHHFVTIGKGAMIGGMSRINKDCLPFSITEGSPAKTRGLNSIGLSRNGYSKDDISALKKAVRIYYKADENASAALETIKADKTLNANEHVQYMVDFLTSTAQGEYGRALEGSR